MKREIKRNVSLIKREIKRNVSLMKKKKRPLNLS